MTPLSQSILGNLLVVLNMAPIAKNQETVKLQLSQGDRAISLFGVKRRYTSQHKRSIATESAEIAAERDALHIATAASLCRSSKADSPSGPSGPSSIMFPCPSYGRSSIRSNTTSASSKYIALGYITPSTCRTRSSSTTLFEDAIPDALTKSARVKLESTAAYQAGESDMTTLSQDIERLRARLEIAATQHAQAMSTSMQDVARLTAQNATLLQKVQEYTTLVNDQRQIISSLTAQVQRQSIEIDTVQTVEQDSDRVIDALIRGDRDLRSARAQAEAQAIKAEARTKQAESQAASAEGKVASAAVLIDKARATALGYQLIVDQAKAKVVQAEAKVVAAETQVTAISQELDQLHIKLAVLETENAEYSQKIESLQTEDENVKASARSASSALSENEQGFDTVSPEVSQLFHVVGLEHVNLELLEHVHLRLLGHGAQSHNDRNIRSWLKEADSDQDLDWNNDISPSSRTPFTVDYDDEEEEENEDKGDDEDESYRRLMAIHKAVVARFKPNGSMHRGPSVLADMYATPQACAPVYHAVEWSSDMEDEDDTSESYCCYIVPSPTCMPSTDQEDSDADSVTTPVLKQVELEDDDTFFQSDKTSNPSKKTFTIPDTPVSHVWIPYMRDWVSKENVDDGDEVDALTPSPTFQPCHAM